MILPDMGVQTDFIVFIKGTNVEMSNMISISIRVKESLMTR